jgi:glyoxylase-like metal-dependent hydrolase (beta-lactamase superfamily II)
MWEEIGGNIYASFGTDNASHAYVLVGKKVALIDSGLAPSARQLKEGLNSIGITPKDVQLILHTHGHADNFALDYLFPKAEVWMHPADAIYVNAKDPVFSIVQGLNVPLLKWPAVVHTFTDKLVFDLGNFSVQALFTPGHTKGSVSFMEQTKRWLFCGDALFSTGLGRWDLTSGNKPQVISSARKILFSSPKMILPGHGLPIKARGSASIARQLERLMMEEVPEAFY